MPGVETVEYTVQRGETLQKLVARAGFPPRDWIKLYNAAYNRKLRALRPDPEAVQPGDRLHLPKYTPQAMDAILLLLTSAQVRLDRLARAASEFERTLAALSDPPRKARVIDPGPVQAAAKRLDKTAAEAGRDCAQAMAALGPSARGQVFEFRPLARDLSRAARKLKAAPIPPDRALQGALKSMAALGKRLTRSHADVDSDIRRHAAALRAMARALY